MSDCCDNNNITQIIGKEGPQGTQGVKGDQGDSTYQVWIDEGNVGTEQDFLDTLVGPTGTAGTDGEDGWSPILAIESDGERRVQKVTGWTGGTGTPPASDVYIGITGFVPDIASATDIRGAVGASGSVPLGTIVLVDTTAFVFFITDTGLGIASSAWEDYAICDGRNGTEDLRAHNVYQIDYTYSGETGHAVNTRFDAIGKTEGELEVQLAPANIPEHQHEGDGHDSTLSIESGGEHGHTWTNDVPMKDVGGKDAPLGFLNDLSEDGISTNIDPTSGGHTHSTTDFAGLTGKGSGLSSNPTTFDILNPMVVLAYVKKII